MTVSAAKIKPTAPMRRRVVAPTTQFRKTRSLQLNAVKHGMRAATQVGGRRPQERSKTGEHDRAASPMHRGAAEQRIVDNAVEYSWLRDHTRRALEARSPPILSTRESTSSQPPGADHEVLLPGQLLFSDNRGPLANYPHYDRPITRTTIGKRTGTPSMYLLVSHFGTCRRRSRRPPSTWCFENCKRRPAAAGGCSDSWSELRSILEEAGLAVGIPPHDRPTLGRQPMEAVDDRNVLMVFVACQAIESRTSIPIPEIWNELREYERKPYAQRLIGRGIEKLRPTDAAAARQALYAIVDRATAQIRTQGRGASHPGRDQQLLGR